MCARLCCSRIRLNLLLGVKPTGPLFSTASRTWELNSTKSSTSNTLLPFKFHFQYKTIYYGATRVSVNFISPSGSWLPSPVVRVPARGVVNVSKRQGKKKTVKAVTKRFHRTGSGKLKYWLPGKVHNMLSKSRNHRRRLCKPRYATKTQLKTLNKMISGW